MATILRRWSYQYPWLYDSISRLAALGVGGETRLRQLALQGLSLGSDSLILDLCCGAGQTTRYLLDISPHCTGVDLSRRALDKARFDVPSAQYVVASAEALLFTDQQFDLVHTSLALHEMTPAQLTAIYTEVYRVLKPSGIFTFLDFHTPTNGLFWPPLALFMSLLETETAWSWLDENPVSALTTLGFRNCHKTLYAGGSLQVIQARK